MIIGLFCWWRMISVRGIQRVSGRISGSFRERIGSFFREFSVGSLRLLGYSAQYLLSFSTFHLPSPSSLCSLKLPEFSLISSLLSTKKNNQHPTRVIGYWLVYFSLSVLRSSGLLCAENILLLGTAEDALEITNRGDCPAGE